MTSWGGRRAQRLVQLCLATYGDICHLCGLPGSNSADHLVPRSRGGNDSIDNLRPAHRRCNYARGNKPLKPFTPPAPDGLEFFRQPAPDAPRRPSPFPPKPNQNAPAIVTLTDD